MFCEIHGWLDGWAFLVSIVLTPIMILFALGTFFRMGMSTWLMIVLRGDQPATLLAFLYTLATVFVAAPFMVSLVVQAEDLCRHGGGG